MIDVFMKLKNIVDDEMNRSNGRVNTDMVAECKC